jgi:UrcA family protein
MALRVSYERVAKHSLLKGNAMTNLKSVLVAAVAAAGIGFAAAAGAQATDQVPTLVVRYNPASLDTDSGVRHLYVRLVAAAERVCVQPEDSRLPGTAVLECRKQAVAKAVAQIHNPRLAAISAGNGKSG